MDKAPRTSPVLAGLALVGAGLALRFWQPSALALPEPDDKDRNDRGARRAARKSRDGLARILPSNLTGSIGRSLVFMGAGMLVIRALDLMVEEEDSLF